MCRPSPFIGSLSISYRVQLLSQILSYLTSSALGPIIPSVHTYCTVAANVSQNHCNWFRLATTVRLRMQISPSSHSPSPAPLDVSLVLRGEKILVAKIYGNWQLLSCILCPFSGFGIMARPQLAWRRDARRRELRLTGLPSLPTVQPFIKSMPPLNTTLPRGAGPC